MNLDEELLVGRELRLVRVRVRVRVRVGGRVRVTGARARPG